MTNKTMSTTTLDSITTEILWNRLISIVEESETTLVRTSFSPIVGEANDHAAALLDAHGNILAQTPSALPAFIGILGRTTRAMLEYFPASTLRPGDILATNDPWICCGHLNDVNVLRPIFHKDKLVGFAANTAHLTDIGGRLSAESSDLFEEGLQIPPTKLFKEGVRNEEVFRFMEANSRVPKQIIGDLNAQLFGVEVADRRVGELLSEYGFNSLEEISQEIQARTEKITRETIAGLPDGDYFGEVTSDGYDEPIQIKVRITISGDSLTIDYSGTSAQVKRAINCPFNLTYAESVWAVRAAIAPEVPTTEGSLRPFEVTAPDGSILNPRYPAAVYSRTLVVHNAHAAIFKALSQIVPNHLDPSRIQANSGCIWGFRFRGEWTEDQRPDWETQPGFVSSYLHNGGQGATGATDGMHCMSYPDNCANVPIEVVENRTPIVFLKKEIRQDSGGPGEFRGGCGQTVELQVLSEGPVEFIHSSGDKINNPPFGLSGGVAGEAGSVLINQGKLKSPYRWVSVEKNDVIRHAPPGGGGFGDPLQRPSELVLADVRDGYVSRQTANDVYGVVISDDLEVLTSETDRHRDALLSR